MTSRFAPSDSSSCDIVIVNWNAGEQIINCLESISDTGRDGFVIQRVVVVDNASTDGSVAEARKIANRLPLTVIANADNRGFGAACNQGAAGSAADYLLFLNPDTRLSANALSHAIGFMERPENGDVGVCSIPLSGEDGVISRTCARRPLPRHFAAKMLGLDRIAPSRFPSHIMEEWDHGDTRDVDHVMGAFYLIRRNLFEQLCGFDERFFVYLEDLDLSIRVRDAGQRIVYIFGSRAFHRGGGTSERVKAARLFYSLRSRIQYGYKHFGVVPATLLLWGTLLLEPPIRLAVALGHRSLGEAGDTLRGMGRLWASLPTLGKRQ